MWVFKAYSFELIFPQCHKDVFWQHVILQALLLWICCWYLLSTNHHNISPGIPMSWIHTILGGKKTCKRLVLKEIKIWNHVLFQHLRRSPSWQGAVNKSKAITRWRCWWSITSLPSADLAMRRELTRVRLELNYGVNNRWLSWPGSPRYLWDASRVDGCYEFLCCVLIEKII